MAKAKPAPRRKAAPKKAPRKPRAAKPPAKRKAKAKAKARPSRARPLRSKFTAPRRKAILASLELGAFRYAAAAAAGLGERTLKEWISRGRREVDEAELAELEDRAIPGLTPWGKFYLEVGQAEAVAESTALAVVTGAMVGGEVRDQLKAATWYLERKHPRRWGSGHRLEVTGKDGGPIEVDARKLLGERLARMAARKDASAGG